MERSVSRYVDDGRNRKNEQVMNQRPAIFVFCRLTIALFLSAASALYGNILIPGCQTLNFKAGQTGQSVMFSNPQENSCNFRITLFLADGQVIWTSELIPPGKTLRAIELDRTLERGIYSNAVMKYECLSVVDGTQVNGAEIRLNIQVR